MKIVQILSETLFPRTCLACHKSLQSGVICEACFANIVLRQTLYCGICEARLPVAAKICHPKCSALFGAAGFYDDPTLKALIHNLKFRNAKEAAEPLAELMNRFISVIPGLTRDAALLVVPIPLSKERMMERGFNQAELIAERLAQKLSLPLNTQSLIKIRHNKAQSETKSLAERQENLDGCYKIANEAAVAKKNILLIDDVSTSGTTFLEAASVLKKAGAKKIIAIAAAKA